MNLQTLILYLCLTTNNIGAPLNCPQVNSAWMPLEYPTLGIAINFNPTDLTILISERLSNPEIPPEYLLAVLLHELAHLKGYAAGNSDGHGPRFTETCTKMSAAFGLDGKACVPAI